VRVAFVDLITDPENPGKKGLSDVVWDHARALRKLGHDVTVVGPYTRAAYPDPDVPVRAFRPASFAYRNLFGYLDTMRRARRELRALGKLDVIHVPDYTASTTLTMGKPLAPVVLTTPGNIFDRIENDANPFDPMMTEWLKFGARRSAKRCARVIAISEDMRTWWRKTGVPDERLLMIPLGIDEEAFRPLPQAPAREALGLPAGAKIVLSVARLSRENGIDTILDAFEALLKREPSEDWRLVLVGDGPETDRLKARAAALGDRVLFPGWVLLEALPQWYAASDVVVLAAHSGGLHRVMLLALSCGKPFVATRISGVVDHVTHGRNGLLVDVGDAPALAESVLEGLGPRGAALGREAREYAVRTFGWDRIARRVVAEAYEPILAGR